MRINILPAIGSGACRRLGLLLFVSALAALFPFRAGAGDILELAAIRANCDPDSIVLGPDGAFWFVESSASIIGRIDTNGVVSEYATITPFSKPAAIVVGPDTNLWFSESQYNQIGRITTNGVITEYLTPPNTIPAGLVTGPDHRLWVLDFGGFYNSGTNGGVMAFTIGTNGPTATNYYNANLTVHSRPSYIAVGPDGKLYFTEQLAGKIGQCDTSGNIAESPLLPLNSKPLDITLGPDGAMWFTEYGSNLLGRIDTTNLTNLQQFALPLTTAGTYGLPYGIVLDVHSNLWYSDTANSALGQVLLTNTVTNIITTNSTNSVTNLAINVIQFFTPSVPSYPRRLAAAPDGTIWFGEWFEAGTLVDDYIAHTLVAPPLSIVLTNGNVILSWPTNATYNFTLQDNTNLAGTNWLPVPTAPVIIGTNFVVTNTATNTLFFRLSD